MLVPKNKPTSPKNVLNWTVGPSVDEMSAPKTTEIFYMKTGVNNN
jgi:hypothetical protein